MGTTSPIGWLLHFRNQLLGFLRFQRLAKINSWVLRFSWILLRQFTRTNSTRRNSWLIMVRARSNTFKPFRNIRVNMLSLMKVPNSPRIIAWHQRRVTKIVMQSSARSIRWRICHETTIQAVGIKKALKGDKIGGQINSPLTAIHRTQADIRDANCTMRQTQTAHTDQKVSIFTAI